MRMRRWGRGRARWGALAAALLGAALGVPHVSGASAAPDAGAVPVQEAPAGGESPPDVLEADGRWTVTLLTGEVVEVRSDAEGRVTAQVREHDDPFTSRRLPDGDLLVLPTSVTPLLGGVLDLDLFNVTGLVRQGYDDAATDAVPLIVERDAGADVGEALAATEDERPLPSIGAVALEVPKGDAAATGELLAGLIPPPGGDPQLQEVAGITQISLDARTEAAGATAVAAPAARVGPARAAQAPPLDGNLTQIGADAAWAGGATGAGTTVAVLDTGVDATHPDLAGRLVAEENFSDAPDVVDHDGHGTHVAGTIVGTGAAAGGARRGVAFEADLLSGKVLDDFGFGTVSGAIAGMEWAASQADVVNMSLGVPASVFDGDDPLARAVDQLSDQHGTLFVIAAGNSGPFSTSVSTPGVAERALTVGAVDGQDALAGFSSRGPVGGYALKPELVAPGVDIVAPRAAGSTLGEPVDDIYMRLSGTSMATPHAAGAAALVAQRHPDWTGDQVKRSLIGATDALDGGAYDVGSGRLDVADALASPLLAGRDAVEAELPAPRTDAHTEEVTWTNTGTEPVTVQLAAALEDRDGATVDAAAVAPAELTVAPGATGTATLTVDAAALEDGFFTGSVTATVAGDGGAVARTPVAFHAVPEPVELTIELTPPAGIDPASLQALVAVDNLDDWAEFSLFSGYIGFGGITVTVPAGRYSVLGLLGSGDRESDVVAQVGDPDVVVDGPTTVAFDGSAAVPLAPRVPGTEVAPPPASSSLVVVTPERGTGGFGLGLEAYSWYPMPPVLVTPLEGEEGRFETSQLYRLQAPHLTVTAGGEPVAATTGRGIPAPGEGEIAAPAVDAGDGADLAATSGAVAVVRYHGDNATRADITVRAAQAGAVAVAFVDESRQVLTAGRAGFDEWGDVPVVFAAGADAGALIGAAGAGEEVTISAQASPFVYDILTEPASRLDPAPVLDRAARRPLARVDQRFHRDPDGAGVNGERRYLAANLMNLDTAGPLPAERTDWVTPGVEWQDVVGARSVVVGFESDNVGVSQDIGRTYEPRSRQAAHWLRRPLWPAPSGTVRGSSFCQPLPVARSADVLHVWLTPFQDDTDRYGCGDPDSGTLTLERDGVPVATEPSWFADFPVPAEPGTYRLTYEQAAHLPYNHDSTTTWTFASQAPEGEGDEPVPLLVVDYDLPLGPDNQPTGRTATLTVAPVTGTEAGEVARPAVWTSTDDGATWTPARVRAGRGDAWDVTLPRVADGTGVSLRVDAGESGGGRIEQTLIDAYFG